MAIPRNHPKGLVSPAGHTVPTNRKLETMKRSAYLDLLRIFSGLWVLLYHWLKADGPLTAMINPYSLDWVPVGLSSFAAFGFLGVDLFFMLSGAVIGESSLGRTSSSFLRARFFRLFPSYVLAVLFAVILLPLAFHMDFRLAYIPSLTGLQLWTGDPSLLGVAWTLKYEAQWYLLVALGLYLWNRANKSALDVKGLWIFLVSVLAVTIFASQFNIPLLTNSLAMPFTYYFIFGAACKQLATSNWDRKWLPVVIISGVFSATVMSRRLVEGVPILGTQIWKYAVAYFLVLAVGGLIVWKQRKTENRLYSRVSKTLELGALMTYPIYLLHAETGQPVISWLVGLGVATPIAMILTFLLIALLSVGMVRVLEPRMKRYFRDGIVSRRK